MKTQHWQILVYFLRKIAEEKGISQGEIARRTDLHRSNVNRFFALDVTPTLSTFLKIAGAIGVNFYFEDKDGTTELNELFEKAMTELGRRPGKLPKN